MYNTPVNVKTLESFTFRASWYRAINRIRSKSVRNRILNYILEYAFTHRFVLTGNATIDSVMILITEQIDRDFGWHSGIEEPEPPEEKESSTDAYTTDTKTKTNTGTEIIIRDEKDSSREPIHVKYPPGATIVKPPRFDYFDHKPSQ